MSEGKSSLAVILAIIMGTGGLVLGGYVFINNLIVGEIQGPPGEDGIDGIDGIDGVDGINGTNAPGYYCASALELQQTLDSIGDESGVITITNDITLNREINVSGEGSYVIQGQTPAITIHSSGDRMSFNISNALFCRIQNLILNVSTITTTDREVIHIEEINNNPVYIENIQILGDSDRLGYGVNISSDQVKITNCYMNQLFTAILIYYGNNTQVSNNLIKDMNQNGIHLDNAYNNIITENSIDSIDYDGIHMSYSSDNLISRNKFSISGYCGIEVVASSKRNIISCNQFFSVYYGVYISSIYNIISSNQINGFTGGAITVTYFYNSITDNIILNGINPSHGIRLNTNGDYCVISGNIIESLTFDTANPQAGIDIYYADYCSIIGNTIRFCTNDGGGDGIGIYMRSNSDFNIVDGNIATDNDDNWYNLDADTIGNETNNYFPPP